MRKVLCCLVGLSLLTASSAFASGYRIPEQSVDATAKSGANIASASGADAAYYNPAGAAWVKDGWLAQINLTYIHLTPVDYDDNRSPLYSGQAQSENFLLPTIFLLSPNWKSLRFGLSVTAPYGLAKRWDDPYPKSFAEKFSLEVYDINPTVTYAFNDKFSVAAGVRMIYATASVMSNGVLLQQQQGPATVTGTGSRALDGDTTEWGYNLAADFRPIPDLNMAVTFRSKVDLSFTGSALLNGGTTTTIGGSSMPGYPIPYQTINTRGAVTIPTPAVLALSASYNFGKMTAELTFDRTYWSRYKSLDFSYSDSTSNPIINAAFVTPKNRDWHDASAIRLGLEYALTNKTTLMAGVCYDESPAPDYTLGFELPDSDAWLFSIGGRYAITDNMEFGLGVLYDTKKSRWVNNISHGGQIDGEISNEAAVVVTAGFQYRF